MIRFNLYKVIRILLPWRRRSPRMIAWIKVFISYLAFILEDLRQFWDQTVKDAKMTPQVCYLEKLLNSRYGVTSIRIVDGYELGPWVFDQVPSGVEIDFFMIEPDNYVYSDQDEITVDFVVQVPHALEEFCNVIAAYVQKYKQAGKIFIIQLI